ncbi:hypothetical protein FF36_01520 [Frankia torreyi]|uniref:Uncharacterized protein n=1 Tax=Frankia torreyi TaxID=1856 RepID=A0A0D8BL44_9ACTN|nr:MULTISPECIES: hypothetical protein [Frankia]KJE24117.1 hypothetical protein FF36_01520 [Frankia torreyi]KQM06034.1 hypothetical protein FF86_101159 [Frankia sp. CpI1-P]
MIWMWEARATPGRLADLRDWAIDALDGREGEVYLSHQPGGDLVVVILRLPDPPPTDVDADAATAAPADPDSTTKGPATAPLPAPPEGLVAGAPHAWPFRQVHPAPPSPPTRPSPSRPAEPNPAG